jgi:MerR family transcriptional regulator, thiopeptide resistance regulator
MQEMTTWTVGQVADVFGVTVRTLHHYDEIGLLVPSERSAAGYRLYTEADLRRLQQIVVYRRLELPLERIAVLLDGDDDPGVHLRRQRDAVMQRLDELTEIVDAIDRALEREMQQRPATTAELKELFGDGFDEQYEQEAQERWGETDAWKQSRSRTSSYTKDDWAQVKAEAEAVNAAFVAALASGAPATSEAAMDAAEQHRRHIHDRFYDLTHDFHRGLADMYVADPRFAKTYDDLAPGLAAYVRDAIHANADRHAVGD